jgi:MAF protein
VSQAAPLYLASSSPRRQALLNLVEMPFTVIEAPVDEEALEASFASPAEELAEHLARSKAAAALASVPDGVGQPARVLAGDTTVLLAGKVLGKPSDAGHAAAMLQALRGRRHMVVTALALAERGSEQPVGTLRTLRVATRVTMRRYSDAEIADYIASGDPFDKAGAYAIQHAGFRPVREIAGCYPAVVGLPVCAAATLLGMRSPDAAHSAGGCPWHAACRLPLPDCAR